MRIAGRFENQNQIGSVVDSLKNLGLNRNDMIIIDLAKEPVTTEQRLRDQIMVQSAQDSIRFEEKGSYADEFEGLSSQYGILVAVEAPKHISNQIREVLEQSGASEIVQENNL